MRECKYQSKECKYLRSVASGVLIVEKWRHITESAEQLVGFGTET